MTYQERGNVMTKCGSHARTCWIFGVMFAALGVIVVAALGSAVGAFDNPTDNPTLNPSLAKKHLGNLNLLVNLSRAGKNSLRAAEADPNRYQETTMTGGITGSIDAHHALILAYDGAEIPDFLTDNFDKILRVTANYFNIEYRNEKAVVWVVDFETLQEIPAGPESCFQVCPTTIGALYVPIFDYLLFTPQYMNDYYVTHELLHYFIDRYEEVCAGGLPQTIAEKCPVGLPLRRFLKKNEEKIVIELSKIIIRKSLLPYLLRSV